MSCKHLLCELHGRGCSLAIDRNYGIGGQPAPSTPPPERIELAQRLLDSLDVDAVKAEQARQRMLATVAQLVELAREEAYECRNTQSDSSITARAALLHDKISSFTVG